ncbi:type I polyketide synthase [Nonomuraea sediminis]|uniref:type I polyketide synthase n=1 Tax=Nonomuraea sediminis TaxID=2835864 RepID=UPI001BDC6AAE|nr:type I polyketide synthase [Nonomuraea sediminis]
MDVGEGEIRRFLAERIAAKVPGGQVDLDRPLEEYGLSSRDAVGIAGELAELLGRELSPTLVWEYPTIDRLAAALSGPPTRNQEGRRDPGEPIAVVGVGCRVPGAHGPEAFWRLLIEGGDAVSEVPPGRWEAFDDGSAGAEEVLAGTTRHGGFLDDVAGFDAEFFGISPGEAAAMDPQQRLLLETAWEALEHAAIAPRSLRGSRTAAYVGISGNEYAYLTSADLAQVDAWTATGAALSIAANRLSYLLDLRGPSMAVDTACSSSLVATHLAVGSLRSGECDLALAAGVNLLLSPLVTVAFDRGGGTAPDGRCKAFDAAADGMVRAEGCGVVVLKRLADAIRDGDRVLAVIRASAVNQDGRSNGLVAPNPLAQEELLREVYGGLDRGPDYVEAHGTGTFLGDPIEARAITAALPGPVLIGSVKSNLGHLEAAAGVIGLIKTVLALHHGTIPASLHYHAPNPHISWDALQVVTCPTPWPAKRARAGVSAFGFGGTNAHVALDAFPDISEKVEQAPTAKHVVLLSDISPDRIREHAALLDPGAPLGDLAHTLARRAGRGHVAAALVAGDAAELTAGLTTLTPRSGTPGRGPVWVFSGYGSQWPGMGRALYAAEPAYRAAIDELAPMLTAEAGIDVFAPQEGVACVQPMIFAVQVALARLWTAYGFEPAAVIGHSMGEVAAAVVAGALPLPDAVRVICRRARLLGTLGGGGAMAVLEVPAEEIPHDLHVAVHTAPRQVVVTGDPHRVARHAAEVEARGLFARTLTAEGAGHSPQVQPLLPRIRQELADLSYGPPAVPSYSTVLDDPRQTPVFDPAYWAAGVRRPVRFMQAVQAATEDGHTVFTELSPHPLLTSPLHDTTAHTRALVTHSLARGTDEAFYTQLATVATAVPPRTRGRVIDVPSPPWHHTRHWPEPRRRAEGHRLLGRHVETQEGHAWTTRLDDLSEPPWRLDPAAWHRHGHPVLPLQAVTRLATAAATQVHGEASLSQVTLHAPLPLPSDVTITLRGDEIRITAKNAAGRWTTHATATTGPAPCRETDLPDVPIPVTLESKLLHRTWIPAPLDPVGERTDRTVVVVPPGLTPRETRDTILELADLARKGARLTIVTRHAQAVLDTDRPDPGPASLRALVRVLALEHPECRAKLVDVDTLEALDHERETADDEIAWRDGTRYAARLSRTTLPEATTTPAAGPGAYIITGGYGRLGRIVARWLADRGATRIVVNGRTGRATEVLGELVAGDLAEDGTAERLVAAATKGGMRLRGIVHAAGVLDDRLIADLDHAGLANVWRAKVEGALRLHEATKGLDLDWWAGFSSAAGLLGSPGQAAYATANAWLDALIELRRAEGLPGIGIAWGTWTGAAAMPAVEALTEEEGVEALEALIQRDLSAGVVRLDREAAVAMFPGIGRLAYFGETADRGDAGDVAATVRQRAAAVLGHDEAWLDDGTVLTALGLDSLAATRLRGMIEYDFGVVVDVAPLLKGGTLGELADAVAAGLGLRAQRGPRRIGPRDAAERQVVRVVAGLLGHEPSVTDEIPPDVVNPALDLLARELGRPLRGFDQPSVAQVADAIRAADEGEAGRGLVRRLNDVRTGRPLFLAHPAGGTTGVYALLAARLDVPVLGLERVDEPLDIPGRAERYAQAITDTCGGQYRIGGWSFGGILAFEVARQLEGAVELVLMIDSGLPDEVPADRLSRIRSQRYVDFCGYLRDTYGVDVQLALDDLLELDEGQQLDLAERRIAESGVLGMLSPAILRHQITSHEDTRAIEAYRPRPYAGEVVLFRSTEPTPWAVEDARYAHRDDPARGFGPYSPGLEIVQVPGSHHLNLLDPPHVEVVADHMNRRLT